MTEELAIYEGDGQTGQLIALALNKGADPAVLSKLMDLQERWEAQKARKAFVLAMSAFKQEAPAVLRKGDTVDFTTSKGRTKYNYANLGSIVQEITAILGKHELSATWQTCQDDKGNITVTCNVTHSAGHRESVTLTGPPDESGNKNRIQAVGSAVTYLQRYTLLAALGLATAEDDDDGRGHKPEGQQPPTKPPQERSAASIAAEEAARAMKDLKNAALKLMVAKGIDKAADQKAFWAYVMEGEESQEKAQKLIERFDEYYTAYSQMIDGQNEEKAE